MKYTFSRSCVDYTYTRNKTFSSMSAISFEVPLEGISASS